MIYEAVVEDFEQQGSHRNLAGTAVYRKGNERLQS